MKYCFTILIILNFSLAFAIGNDLNCHLSTSYIAPEVIGEDMPKEVEIIYELENSDYVTVYIKDEEKIVYTVLKDCYKEPGIYKAKWNGKDAKGNTVKNGEYIVEITNKSGLKGSLNIKVVDLIAKISLPAKNSLVRADVPVWGLACGKDFKEFRLEYGEGSDPKSWVLINKSTTPVTRNVRKEDLVPEKQPLKGNLGIWETGLTNYYYKDYNVDLKGIYTIRLEVSDTNGNSVEDRKTVEIGNVISNVFGGVVESNDSKVKLNFEEHSLYEPFLVISIKPLEDVDLNMPYELIGKVYEIRPAGTGFNKLGILEMKYDIVQYQKIDQGKLGIYIYDEKNGWQYFDTAIDKENNRLISKIDYLSGPRAYCAVFYNPEKSNSIMNDVPEKQDEEKYEQTKQNENLILSTFENNLGNWKAWKGTVLERDNAVTSNGSYCLKLLNNQWGGYFGVTVIDKRFNAKEYPILEFDYKISPEVKINILIKVGGRWYEIIFTDDPKQYLRINMKKLGEIKNVQADNNWHHAQSNILEGLQKYTNDTWVEKIILADFDSNEYMGLKPGSNLKDVSYYIDNFCIRKAGPEEFYQLKEVNNINWQIGEDDGSNDELAYEKYEGQFKNSDTSDDFYIGCPQGEFERAVSFDDQIVNIYFALKENEAKEKYIFYIDVIDCDLRTYSYVKFGVYINDKLIDTYTCYLKKGQLYAVPIEKDLKTGQNKITIRWLEGGNWISWDYVAFKPIKYKEEIKVTIKKDKIYINGEQFLVKGIGYSPFRPGNLPWGKRPELQTVEKDFKLIKEAGFNTIRSWAPLTEEELNLAKEYKLMVIQGIWVDPIADPLRISSKKLSPILLNELKQKIRRYNKYDNILLCLIGNEIPIEGVYHTGVVDTEKLLTEMKKAVKEVNPESRVSFANWAQVLFLDSSFWDIVAYNLYPYYPVTISHSLGYYGTLEWLKNKYAFNKPLLITEYGMSVSPNGPGNFGYGGNTIEQQQEAIVSMYDDIVQSGACGGCLFEWNDEWWKNYEYKGDEDTHNNEPEEWFGILGIEGIKENYLEKLRPAYYAIKDYNQAIIVEPKKYKFYKKSIPIEIYTTEDVYSVRFKIDDSGWIGPNHSSTHWWRGEWKSQDKEVQSHILTVEAIDKDGEVICKKQMTFWTGLTSYIKEPRYFVCIDCKEIYYCGGKPELINVLFKVVDEKKKPVKGVTIKYSFYETRLWEQVCGEKITDENGTISVDYYIREPGYIIIAAGVDYKYKDFKKRYCNIKFVEVLSLKR